MFNVIKGGLLGSLIRILLTVTIALFVFLFGIALSFSLTYGVLINLETGTDIIATANQLISSSYDVILSELGSYIFSNIPFADLLNALFITNVTPSMTGLFQDVVTSALAGLVFFIIARLNLLISRITKSKLLFGAIVSFMTVFSICAAMIGIKYLTVNFSGTVLTALLCGVFAVSLILHCLFLFLSARSIRFVRILWHTILDLLNGICNNVFFWLCSFLFMSGTLTGNLPADDTIALAAFGGFFLWGFYSILMNTITSALWHR